MADALVKTGRLVTLFGGSGFIGRNVVRALHATAGASGSPRDGQISPFISSRWDKSDKSTPFRPICAFPNSVVHALRDAEVVVNLVGILSETGEQTFDAVQAAGAQAVAKAAKAAGAGVFVQLSAIGADAGSASVYARSKARGETLVAEAFPGAIVLQPSVVFGPEDKFFNRFAAMARYMPALPLIGGGERNCSRSSSATSRSRRARRRAKGQGRNDLRIGRPGIATLRRIMEFVLKVDGAQTALSSTLLRTGQPSQDQREGDEVFVRSVSADIRHHPGSGRTVEDR